MDYLSKQTVAAVVVTYNRKDLLDECLQALLKQTYPLDAIILIDNASTDGTRELLESKGYLENPLIDYVRLEKNTGGSGGFYEGVKRGYNKGYDWLWLMDDDAEPMPDALEKLVEYFGNKDIVALACLKVDIDSKPLLRHCGYFNFKYMHERVVESIAFEEISSNICIDVDFSSFVGLLVNKKGVDKIGLPLDNFFIHHDDVEYCIRLKAIGCIILVTNSLMIHKEEANKDIVQKTFVGRCSKRIRYDKLWIKYYGHRNLIWLTKRYAENKFIFYVSLLLKYLRLFLGILLYDDNKIKRFRFYIEAVKDGIMGVFDNDKPKKILY